MLATLKSSEEAPQPKRSMLTLMLGAIGVVFGDIGTSPLYTFQECINPAHGLSAALPQHLYGIVSLIFWSLIIVVTFKYVTILMQADNRGEGGIMALMALLPERMKIPYPGKIGISAILVIAGASLLFGDGVITPAISVLSAVEGLKTAAPDLGHFVVPITVVILIGLFSIQYKGTEKIGRLFGPVTLLWFLTIAILGLRAIFKHPEVIFGLSPTYAAALFIDNPHAALRSLGSVVLAVTGAEALYADMGHFGKRPIQLAWIFLILPSLILNYLGQAANLVQDPSAATNPFFALVPSSLIYPITALATAATIIASQALLSGAFSLTRQAIRLGYFPRLTVKQTSEHGEGQIYIPFINFILAVICIALVLEFRESSRLASAYGLAVCGTFVITAISLYLVTRHTWKWGALPATLLLILLLSFDLPFLISNSFKFFEGGWIPVFIGSAFFITMYIWKRGRSLLGRHFVTNSPPLDQFIEHLDKKVNHRIPGTAVFLASSSNGVPPVVTRMVNRFHTLHTTVILLTVTSEVVPYYCKHQHESNRIDTENLGEGFYRVIARYGFMETPNVPKIMEIAFKKLDLYYWARDILYVLGHESIVDHNKGVMKHTEQALFAFLSRNARNATDYFRLPPDQVIELGTQIDL